jgi:hypothetical protein
MFGKAEFGSGTNNAKSVIVPSSTYLVS